jgi:hypothetical protein
MHRIYKRPVPSEGKNEEYPLASKSLLEILMEDLGFQNTSCSLI